MIVVFTPAIEIDEIIFNNFHNYGGSTIYGLKDIVISVSDQELVQSDTSLPLSLPSTLPGAVEIFNGQVRQHVTSDIRDDEVLALNIPEPTIGVEVDAAIELFGSFEVNIPPPSSVELAATLELFGGFNVDVAKPVELAAILELFGGFEVDVDKSVEFATALELFGGFEVEIFPRVGIELSAAIELFGGFEVSVDKSVELSAIIELFGGFNVHIDTTECRLPKFNQKRWC